jgi:hypothetical protein
LYLSFSSFVSLDAKRMESRMAAESPRKVLGRAEFSRLVAPAVELREETVAPAMLNLGQLMKAIMTPMKPSRWLM